MESITEYVEQQGITAKITKDRGMLVDQENGSSDALYGKGWLHHAYRVRLRKPDGTKTPVFDWKQGEGIEESPEDRPDSILDALVSDAFCYINAHDFEDFAADLGYDSDSRKAERIYKECGKIAEWLDEFLDGELERVATEYERL